MKNTKRCLQYTTRGLTNISYNTGFLPYLNLLNGVISHAIATQLTKNTVF